MAKRGPDEQKPHMRLDCRIRRQIPLKSKTYPEGRSVYEAGIRVKVRAHYPGRPLYLLKKKLLSERSDGMGTEESAEAIVFRHVGRRAEHTVTG